MAVFWVVVVVIGLIVVSAVKVIGEFREEETVSNAEAGKPSTMFGIMLTKASIRRGAETHKLAGVSAAVETVGELQRRITVTRLATLGVFALAARKRVDQRELYMTITGRGFQWLLQLPAGEGSQARRFAAVINNAALRAAK